VKILVVCFLKIEEVWEREFSINKKHIMVGESYPWKEELLKIATSLKYRLTQKRWSQRSSFLFEKEIFISFYIIRKLIESKTLSNRNLKLKIKCLSIHSTNYGSTYFNRHKLETLFDFTKTREMKIELVTLCNQIIHSYIFEPSFDDEFNVFGFFVSSDERRNKSLYLILIDDIIKVFNIIGNDYPNALSSLYNDNSKDYKVIQSMIKNIDDEKLHEKMVKSLHNKRFSTTV
jgi:hypothetical protein